jgi:formylglycine-generating enzyme required for sulfatase activity
LYLKSDWTASIPYAILNIPSGKMTPYGYKPAMNYLIAEPFNDLSLFGMHFLIFLNPLLSLRQQTKVKNLTIDPVFMDKSRSKASVLAKPKICLFWKRAGISERKDFMIRLGKKAAAHCSQQRSIFLHFAAFLLYGHMGYAQSKQLNTFYGVMNVELEYCIQERLPNMDKDIEKLVALILDKIQVNNSFQIVPCNRTENALATVDERGRPFILFNPEFLQSVKSLNFTTATISANEKNWEKLAILAHEIGHHLNFHLTSSNKTAHQKELEADQWAGYILFLLGAKIEEATSVMKHSAVPIEGSGTHPPRAQRIMAIEQGWKNAEKKFPGNPSSPSPKKPYAMVLVRGGSFFMGCTPEQSLDCESDEKPNQKVEISDFYLGQYEVTQKEWVEVMGSNPSNFNNCDDCPVENISWNDVQEFIPRLNAKTGINYRLPTEAEWEYAARGGANSLGFKFSGSNALDEVGWYDRNSSSTTNFVGQRKANEIGLYDMSGNVWEWCQDRKGNYLLASQENPKGPFWGQLRVARGGSFDEHPLNCRVSCRAGIIPTTRDKALGLRLARTP